MTKEEVLKWLDKQVAIVTLMDSERVIGKEFSDDYIAAMWITKKWGANHLEVHVTDAPKLANIIGCDIMKTERNIDDDDSDFKYEYYFWYNAVKFYSIGGDNERNN